MVAPGGGHWETVTATIYQSITVQLADVSGITVGMSVNISGNAGFNGSNLSVTAVDNVANTIKVAYGGESNVSGAGGTLTLTAPSLTRYGNVVTANTGSAHGLNSGDQLTISGVANNTIGTGISSAVRVDNVITFTTSSDNGVRVGSKVIVAGVTDSTFNGTWEVTTVIDSKNFQVTSSNLADASSSSGTVSDQWNNTQRFVISVPSSTSFTYAEVGPDDSTTAVGTVTPVGEVAGGVRNAVCLFKTKSGYLTPPSTPVKVVTSGNKKLFLTGIPIGPSNVVERIIAFTGIDGSRYFYIPVPARNNGTAISTSTVIPDNTSTSALLDFSDATLLSALAIDIGGNDLFELKLLGNCSGVSFYGDRMWYWGDENVAINFQNMGFEGGLDANNLPLGWTVTGSGLSVVTNGDFGDAIQYAAGSTAIISQGAYLDYYGDQILEPSTQYTFKCWARQSDTGASVVAEIYDTNTSTVLASATIPVPTTVGFISGVFSAITPGTITSTTVLRVRVTGNGSSIVTLDEFRVIYTENPYNDGQFSVSYVINPESVDAVTGILGATSDSQPIMDASTMPDKGYTDASRMPENFYFVTRGTQGSLHTTKATAGQEPANWSVAQVSRNCGACSMFSMISGESWVGWACDDGFRLFDTSDPIKITQDFQAKWDAINKSALTSVWGMNDVTNRRMYWGVPIGSTDTNKVYMLDYRYAETASQIEDRGAIRISQFTGKMLVIEMSRKFSPWTIPATAGGFITRSTGVLPAFSDASGRTYTLDPTKLSDDDYGTIPSYYVTSPFVSGELEQALQLGNHRHLYTFLSAAITGTGKITITPLADTLTNAWPARGPYNLSQSAAKLLEVPLNVGAEKCFFKFSVAPQSGQTDAAFNLSRMTVTMEPHPFSPVRAAA